MAFRDPKGYPESGRLEGIAHRLGRSHPEYWGRNPNRRRAIYPNYKVNPSMKELLKETARLQKLAKVALALPAKASVTLRYDKLICNSCGSAVWPHICW